MKTAFKVVLSNSFKMRLHVSKVTFSLLIAFITTCVVFFVLTCSGCTLSVILTNTRGVASDIVDSDPKTTTETDAEVTVPTSLLGV